MAQPAPNHPTEDDTAIAAAVVDVPAPPIEPLVRASERTYDGWLHAVIHLSSFSGMFRHIGAALSCFHKTEISVNEVLERLSSVLGRRRTRGDLGPLASTSELVGQHSVSIRRLQDQVSSLQRYQEDLWRELASLRDAQREHRAEPHGEREHGQAAASRGWASNRDELFTDYHSRHDETARRGGY